MTRKKTIQQLIDTIEVKVKNIDSIDTSIEDTLKDYEETIRLSKNLLDQLNQKQEKFKVLQKQCDDILND